MINKPTESKTPSNRRNAAITIIFAHAVKHIFHAGQISLIMPEIKLGLGLNRAQFGSLATSSSVGWWIATMAAGYFGDRFSNHAGRMIALSMGLMGIAFFLAGVAPNYKIMLLVMFLAGVGPSIFHPPAIGELARTYPEKRGLLVSLNGMAANVGEVLGAPIVAALLTFLVWRQVMAGSVIPALILASTVWILVPSRNRIDDSSITSAREYFSSLLKVLKNRVILLLMVTTATRSIGDGAIAGFITLYMREDLDYSLGKVALFISLSQIAGIVSLPVMGFLSDKIGRKPVLISASVLVMASALALSVAEPGYQLFIAILVRGAFAISLHHIVVAAALDNSQGTTQSTVVSLMYGAGFIGTFAPYLAGLISDQYGIRSAFLSGGIVLIIPVLLLSATRFPRNSSAKPE